MPQIMIPAIADDGSHYPVEKLDAHVRGNLHLAVSIFVFSGTKLLLQQRALGKYHSGGLWANTVCTHPNWGEDIAGCASRRIVEELGFSIPLKHAGEIKYSADVGSGLTENEHVHLFVGHTDAEQVLPDPDPAEVMATRWLSYNEICDGIARNPDRFTPWLRIYIRQLSQLFPV